MFQDDASSLFATIDDITVLSRDIDELGDLDDQRLWSVLIDVLSWLKLQHRFGKDRALKIKTKYRSGNDLIQIMQQDTFLSRLFVIDGKTLDFRPELDEDQRQFLREQAAQHYNPIARFEVV